MVSLDKIDKNIIYELSNNSRLTYKQLAKKINSKKDTVYYHLNNLINSGVIKKFVPVYSISKLNILTYKIYFKLQGLDEKKEKELYNDLLNDKKIDWVAKVIGHWDLFIGIYCKTPIQFSKIKDELLSRLSDIITNYQVVQMANQTLTFGRDYLLDKPLVYRREFVFIKTEEKVDIDKTDLNILKEIRNNGRFRYLDISKKLDLNEKTLRERIKNLHKKNIIQGYTTFLDLNKIGFYIFKLSIYLKTHKKEEIEKLVNFLKQYPNTLHLIKCLGPWELEIEIESDNVMEIYNYSNFLKNKFYNTIKQIDLSIITNEIELNFFPIHLNEI